MEESFLKHGELLTYRDRYTSGHSQIFQILITTPVFNWIFHVSAIIFIGYLLL